MEAMEKGFELTDRDTYSIGRGENFPSPTLLFEDIKPIFKAAYINGLFDKYIHFTGMMGVDVVPTSVYIYKHNIYDFFKKYPYGMTRIQDKIYFAWDIWDKDGHKCLSWKVDEEDVKNNSFASVEDATFTPDYITYHFVTEAHNRRSLTHGVIAAKIVFFLPD